MESRHILVVLQLLAEVTGSGLEFSVVLDFLDVVLDALLCLEVVGGECSSLSVPLGAVDRFYHQLVVQALNHLVQHKQMEELKQDQVRVDSQPRHKELRLTVLVDENLGPRESCSLQEEGEHHEACDLQVVVQPQVENVVD